MNHQELGQLQHLEERYTLTPPRVLGRVALEFGVATGLADALSEVVKPNLMLAAVVGALVTGAVELVRHVRSGGEA